MRRYRVGMGSVVVAVLVAGCVTTPTAPRAAAGAKIRMMVLSERGSAAEMGDRQYQYRNEVGAWMERDLLNRLTRSGYEATLIKTRDAFQPQADHYLLVVRIVSYNPGSSAARMIVGFGAGAASLNNEYELYGAAPDPLLSWEDGVGTSEHWKKLPRKLNANAVKRITDKLVAVR